MASASPADTTYAHVLLLGLAALLLADLVLVVSLLAARARGRRLLALRWSAAHVLIAFQAWLALTIVAAGVGAIFLAAQPHGGPRMNIDDPSLRPFLLLVVVAQNVAMVVVVLYTVEVVYDQYRVAAGLSLKHWAPRATLGLLSALVVLPLNGALERLSSQAVRHAPLPGLVQRGFDSQMQQFLGAFRGPGGLLMAILVIGIVAPFSEELFFRGFAYHCFRARWGRTVAILASAALFAVIHVNPAGLLSIFFVGCALAYLYEKTGTLVAPIVLHATNNIVLVLAYYLGGVR